MIYLYIGKQILQKFNKKKLYEFIYMFCIIIQHNENIYFLKMNWNYLIKLMGNFVLKQKGLKSLDLLYIIIINIYVLILWIGI